jgi:hypothetical protein
VQQVISSDQPETRNTKKTPVFYTTASGIAFGAPSHGAVFASVQAVAMPQIKKIDCMDSVSFVENLATSLELGR